MTPLRSELEEILEREIYIHPWVRAGGDKLKLNKKVLADSLEALIEKREQMARLDELKRLRKRGDIYGGGT